MDIKKIFGKTIFFIFIVSFVALFSYAFGSKNALIGVMIIVAALMLMGRDMTSKAGLSFLSILVINMAIGLGSFIASSNIWLGLIINFTLVFSLTYTLASDMKSSVEFPFLLGYILVLSMPVTAEELPLRMLSLVIGTIFIVGLNLIIHKKAPTEITSHSGIISLLNMVCDSIDKVSNGETVDPELFNKGSMSIRSGIFDRLQKNFYTTPESRSVMNMAVSIEQLGKSICREKIDKESLTGLKDVLYSIRSCTALETTVADAHAKIIRFTEESENIPFDIISGLKIIDYELCIISDDPDIKRSRYGTDKGISMENKRKTMLYEELNRNSMAFSYAFRLAILIATFEFLAIYFDVLAARWLAFTSLAICTPYVDRDIEKAKMRIKGAITGIFIFTAITLVTSDYYILMGIMLLLNYIYTLFDPMRYDLKMMFTNISALITAVLVLPEFGTGLDDAAIRLLCILGGTVIVIICNRLILPYRIHTENIKLGNRSLNLAKSLISDLSATASGKGDDVGSACEVLSADLVSEKIRGNVFQCPDDDMEMFMHHQSEVITRCAFYRNGVNKCASNKSEFASTVKRIVDVYGSGNIDIPVDAEDLLKGLDAYEYEYAKGILETARMYRTSVSDLERYKTKIDNGYKPKQIPYAEMH